MHLKLLWFHRRTGSSDAKGNKHIEHPGDLAGGAGGGGAGTGKTLDRIVNAKEEVSDNPLKSTVSIFYNDTIWEVGDVSLSAIVCHCN